MKVNRYHRIFISAIFLTAFFFDPLFSGSQNRKDHLQKDKLQLETEISYTSKLLKQTQQTKQTSLNKLNILNKQIERRESLINIITGEVTNIQSEMDIQQQQIGKMSDELTKMKDEYAKMIYYAYKNLNSHNRLLFVFSASDFNQAFRRLMYYQQYSVYRRTQAELIRNARMHITQKQRELELIKGEKLTLAQKKELEKLRLTKEREDKDKAVKELSKKEKQLLATLKEKQQAMAKLQKEIENMIASEVKKAAERARKVEKSNTGTKMETRKTNIMLTHGEVQLSNSFASNKGRLPWPSERGVITGSFGEHAHPVLKYVKVKNNGVDIATEKGSAVRAVFAGKVSRVMSFQNLHNVVIIRHGEYLTVYSNLAEVSVKDGQDVTTKQVIGRVYTNPDDAKTELHFEIWLGKTIQNPQEWLATAN